MFMSENLMICLIARLKRISNNQGGLRQAKYLVNRGELWVEGSVPGRIRTRDPLLRRQPLCPAELQGHILTTDSV